MHYNLPQDIKTRINNCTYWYNCEENSLRVYQKDGQDISFAFVAIDGKQKYIIKDGEEIDKVEE